MFAVKEKRFGNIANLEAAHNDPQEKVYIFAKIGPAILELVVYASSSKESRTGSVSKQ
jgi:hypothetical protein